MLAAEANPLVGVIIGAVTSVLAVSATLVGLWLSSRQKRREQDQSGEQFTWQRMRELLDDTRADLERSKRETAEVRAEQEASEARCAEELGRLRERIEHLERQGRTT